MEQSLGQQIKEARRSQNITLAEAAHATKIKERYLRAIEEGHLEELPSTVQQRGFVRSYADYLGLDAESYLLQESDSVIQREDGNEPQKTSSARAAKPGEDDFGDIGKTLQDQRETLGFSVEDVERQIHIHARYLRAIEEGRLDDLPSTVQGKGMLKNYAEFLGLDTDALLLSYADVLHARLSFKKKASPSKKGVLSIPPKWRRFLSGNLMLSLLIVLFLGVVIIWSSLLVFNREGDHAKGTSTIPGVAQVLLPSPTQTLTMTPAETLEDEITVGVEGDDDDLPTATLTPEIQPTQPASAAGNVNIQLIVNQRAWMQVIVDGQEAFTGRVMPGSVHVFDGEERVELLTGNAAAVEVIYNQRDLGVLGLFGEVVNLVYTEEGSFTPTPTISPTPTITPTPEDTPTPTLTPQPTAE